MHKSYSDLKYIKTPAKVHRVPGCFFDATPKFIKELSDFLQGKKVLEIFAGNGYLASLLSQQGVDIVSTSILSGYDCHEAGVYFPVIEMSCLQAVLTFGSDRDVLLMCWPTTTMDVLRATLMWGADKDIVFIGEAPNSHGFLAGCATDEFFEAVEFSHEFSTYASRNMLDVAKVCRLKASGN